MTGENMRRVRSGRFAAVGPGTVTIYVSPEKAELIERERGELPANVRVRRERPLKSSSGFTLAQLRKQMGITQTELADRLGVTQGVVSRIENQTDMNVSTLEEYLDALGGHLELAVGGSRHALRVE